MRDDAIENLDRDERHVKGRRNRKHWAEVFRCVRVVVPMAVHDRHISILGPVTLSPRVLVPCPLCVKADMCSAARYVRLEPIADICKGRFVDEFRINALFKPTPLGFYPLYLHLSRIRQKVGWLRTPQDRLLPVTQNRQAHCRSIVNY